MQESLRKPELKQEVLKICVLQAEDGNRVVAVVYLLVLLWKLHSYFWNISCFLL